MSQSGCSIPVSGALQQTGMSVVTHGLGVASGAIWDKIHILEDRLQAYCLEQKSEPKDISTEVDAVSSKAVTEINEHKKSLVQAAERLDSIICRLDI